jgi:hypothetical protein
MRPSALMKLAGAYLCLIGAASLFLPQSASSGLGQELSAFDLFVARTLGIVLMSIGFIDWSVSDLEPRLLTGVIWANVFLNVALGVLDSSSLVTGTIGGSSWSGISFHVILTGLFLAYLVRSHNGRRASA